MSTSPLTPAANERFRVLVDRLGLESLVETDPVIVGLEAAIAAEESGLIGSLRVAVRAVELCPHNATGFECGVAFGLALALSSKPA